MSIEHEEHHNEAQAKEWEQKKHDWSDVSDFNK